MCAHNASQFQAAKGQGANKNEQGFDLKWAKRENTCVSVDEGKRKTLCVSVSVYVCLCLVFVPRAFIPVKILVRCRCCKNG